MKMVDKALSNSHRFPDAEGVSAISESDYFLKNTKFTIWLKDEKGKVCCTTTLLATLQQGR